MSHQGAFEPSPRRATLGPLDNYCSVSNGALFVMPYCGTISAQLLSDRQQRLTMEILRRSLKFENVFTMDNFGNTTVALLNGLNLYFDNSGICTNIDKVFPMGLTLCGAPPDGIHLNDNGHPKKGYEIKLETETVDLMSVSNREFILPNQSTLCIDDSGIPSIQEPAPSMILPVYYWHTPYLDSKKARFASYDASNEQRLPQDIIMCIFDSLLARLGEEDNRMNEISAICLGLTNKENWRALHNLVKNELPDGPIWRRMPHGTFEEKTLADLLKTWVGPKYRQVDKFTRSKIGKKVSQRNDGNLVMPTMFLSREVYGDESSPNDGHNKEEIKLIKRYADCRTIIENVHYMGLWRNICYVTLPSPFGMGVSWYPAAAKAVLDNFGWREWDGTWTVRPTGYRNRDYRKYQSWKTFRQTGLYIWILRQTPESEEGYSSTTRFVNQKLRDINYTWESATSGDPWAPTKWSVTGDG